jgi:hypothetical protein
LLLSKPHDTDYLPSYLMPNMMHLIVISSSLC